MSYMTERTRRATEVVEAHAEFMEQSRPGSMKDGIESPLLDVCADMNDPRYGHEQFVYDGHGHFQRWLGSLADQAMSFTATIDLWREVLLTTEMMDEEGIDFLPLQPEMLPAKHGLFLFPYGVENPAHVDEGWGEARHPQDPTDRAIIDMGGGDRHMVDGFLWSVSDRVAIDGHSGPPADGVIMLPLTKWRDRKEDRPFRLIHNSPGRVTGPIPTLVASDVTAWAFDEEGQTAWRDPVQTETNAARPVTTYSLKDKKNANNVAMEIDWDVHSRNLRENRLFLRRLLWATFRWLTDEVWIPEDAMRPVSRRIKRARPDFNSAPEDGEVRIVDLRAERKDAVSRSLASDEPPWWRTRWRVRGHWAKRRAAIRDDDGNPVGPTRGVNAIEGETFVYRKVWIEPHIRGPANMPLVYRDMTGVLSR